MQQADLRRSLRDTRSIHDMAGPTTLVRRGRHLLRRPSRKSCSFAMRRLGSAGHHHLLLCIVETRATRVPVVASAEQEA
jgi:hypothetical protein